MVYSILDTDFYKFTTSYAYMKMFPDAIGTFEYFDRNNTSYTLNEIEQLKTIIFDFCENTKLSNNEFNYCSKTLTRYIPQFYWEWLSNFKFNFDRIKISSEKNNDGKYKLHISVTDKLYKCTLYEVPLLSIISEWMNPGNDKITLWKDVLIKLKYKIEISKNSFKFADFGTRRRYSYIVQDFVVGYLSKYTDNFVGTSNVYLAMKYKVTPIGTHPHEWFMFHGAQFGYQHANYLALENWINTYDGDLGIALTDTFTSDAFFNNFSKKHAKLFDGIRQDSGDEYEFVDKAIKRYLELGVNPLSKTIVFSNGLNFEKANKIAKYCEGKINCSFGIGTNLTNDVGFKAPNIVMKLTECQMNEHKPIRKCVKLSDDKGKVLGDKMQIAVCLNSI